MNLTCPHCHKDNDHYTGHPGLTPRHGDVSLCIDCGQLGVFDLHEHALRPPNSQEEREFAANPVVQQYRAAWRTTVGKRRH